MALQKYEPAPSILRYSSLYPNLKCYYDDNFYATIFIWILKGQEIQQVHNAWFLSKILNGLCDIWTNANT